MEIIKYNNFLNENNKPLKKIYLAGGWEDWRDVIIKRLDGAVWLDPRIAIKSDNWFELETEMIRECDALIAWVVKDNPSGFGMTFEMGMAYGLNKPYILINEKEDKYKWSMQTKGSVISFDNVDDAIKWIDNNNWLGLYEKR